MIMSFSAVSQCSDNIFVNGEVKDTLGSSVTASGWQEFGDPDIHDHLSGVQISGWDWYKPVMPSSDFSTWQNLYEGEKIFQQISLNKGKLYRISYEYASQPLLFLFGNGDLSMSADLKPVVWFDLVVAHRGPGTQVVCDWYDDCFLFVAESDKITIAFGHEELGYMAIDNICLEEVSEVGLDDLSLCIGEAVEVEVSGNDFQLAWSTSDTIPSITISEPGNYWLDRFGSCGMYRDEFEVTVEDCGCKVYIPDTFNPSSSGMDSVFNLGSDCSFVTYEIAIFDRWGNLVFEGTDINDSWDGTYLSNEVDAGVYMYKLIYDFLENQEIEFGQINLIR